MYLSDIIIWRYFGFQGLPDFLAHRFLFHCSLFDFSYDVRLCRAFLLELCAAAAAPPPPPTTECRRRAGAVFVTCSRHVVHQLYVARFL